MILGLGVALEVLGDVLYLPREGWSRPSATRATPSLGTIKTLFDLSMVLSAIVVSVLCLGHISGLREGTIVAAATVGGISRFFPGEAWEPPGPDNGGGRPVRGIRPKLKTEEAAGLPGRPAAYTLNRWITRTPPGMRSGGILVCRVEKEERVLSEHACQQIAVIGVDRTDELPQVLVQAAGGVPPRGTP